MRHKTGLRSLAFGAVVAAFACAPADARYAPIEETPTLAADPIQRDIVSETRLYCLALAVYFEGGSTRESEEGQRHVARVVHERAKANRRIWGGSGICDVVFYMRGGVCQFSFACLPSARRTPKGGAAWEYSFSIAQEELEQRSAVQERLTRYYMNPALTSDRNACRFRKEFVPVLEAGRHHFFREPTAAERAQLAKSEPIECKRYAEMLAAQKRLAEARAAKARAKAAKAAKAKRLAAAKAKAKKVEVAGR